MIINFVNVFFKTSQSPLWTSQIVITVSLGQLCMEDVPVNKKLQDKEFVAKQLNCIMAEQDDRCDQFGKQLKRKIFFSLQSWAQLLWQSPFYVIKDASLISCVWHKNATTLWLSRLHFTTVWSFKMRYCMNFYLNFHRNYVGSKLELSNLLHKKICF